MEKKADRICGKSAFLFEDFLRQHVLVNKSDNRGKTLVKSSGIMLQKSIFFVYRAITYCFFLILPAFTPYFAGDNSLIALFIVPLYIFFLVGQWYLLGKEIDHRLKIYFKVNSTLDRIVYRLFCGQTLFFLIFNLFNLVPVGSIQYFYWGTWLLLGLYYSWPTRGKIIREGFSTQFGEYRFLDSFERTLFFLTLLFFILSFPLLPPLNNTEALKLFFDPNELLGSQFWNFLKISYYPYINFPNFLKTAWSLHFYIIGMGSFLMCFYAFLRFCVSRRLALLGVFSIITSWTYSKFLVHSAGYSILTTFSLMWVWALLWVAKSSTYRTGLFLGLVTYYGTVLGKNNFFLVFFQFGALFFFYFREKSYWYWRQVLKYSSFGVLLALVTLIVSGEEGQGVLGLTWSDVYFQLKWLLGQKAFFMLSFLGLIFMAIFLINKNSSKNLSLNFDRRNLLFIISAFVGLYFFSFYVNKYNFQFFALMWPIAFLSVIPIECLFQSISRLRSRRNMIYVIYIVICLLDSHLEMRVKMFISLF